MRVDSGPKLKNLRAIRLFLDKKAYVLQDESYLPLAWYDSAEIVFNSSLKVEEKDRLKEVFSYVLEEEI